MSTRVAPIWAVCVAAAVVAKCAWTASWPSLSARVRKESLQANSRGSDPRTGTLKERRHGGRVLATQIYGCIDGICWFLRRGGCMTRRARDKQTIVSK